MVKYSFAAALFLAAVALLPASVCRRIPDERGREVLKRSCDLVGRFQTDHR